MSLTITTNSSSLEAQTNVNGSQNAMNQSPEHLPSGLRTSSAMDDAAGLSVSSRFTSRVSGIHQAVRNANNGISMLQTADGSMQQITTLLQSMRTLAVQASSDTHSASDRASLQSGMDQFYAEIDRIAGATSFNGVNLLDGAAGAQSFQVGTHAGQTITVNLPGAQTQDLNLNSYPPPGSLNSGLSVANPANAGSAITRIDAAIKTVSEIRGNFSAVQNQLDSTVSNLQNVSPKLFTTNSQITDADIAAETAQLSQSQISAQAGVAMLTQAKGLPQEVMQLIQ